MKLGFLYAGQGSQRPGLGRDFYDEFPSVREIFDYRPLGMDLRSLCFEAEMSKLSHTAHTQPCMGAFAAAVTRLLAESGIFPDCAAGLSLGEYGALHAAGVFGWRDMLDLLTFRGREMARVSKGLDFKMSALVGPREIAERGVGETNGKVWCCNYNCPDQTVIGGERSAVETAEQRCMELGMRRCLQLNVGGPFHTPFMRAAAEKLSAFMSKLDFKAMSFPVISNVTGKPLKAGKDVRSMLAEQIMSPVLFEDGLRSLSDMGVDTVIEIGPGKVLSGFLKKVAPNIKTLNIDTIDDYRSTIAALKGA